MLVALYAHGHHVLVTASSPLLRSLYTDQSADDTSLASIDSGSIVPYHQLSHDTSSLHCDGLSNNTSDRSDTEVLLQTSAAVRSRSATSESPESTSSSQRPDSVAASEFSAASSTARQTDAMQVQAALFVWMRYDSVLCVC